MVIFGFSAWMVQAQPKPPIKIGSTLALTGPLSATGIVHKIVGEIAIEEINRKGGLLGRKIEWILKVTSPKRMLLGLYTNSLLPVTRWIY